MRVAEEEAKYGEGKRVEVRPEAGFKYGTAYVVSDYL